MPNCHNCKHLISDEITDTWVSVGEVSFYCENDKALHNPSLNFDLEFGDDLNPDLFDEYAAVCESFEENNA